MPIVKLVKMHKDKEIEIPKYMTEGAAGADIRACLTYSKQIRINPGQIGVIPTGLKVEIPKGWEIQVRSRSGLAVKGVSVFNSPGTIDSDYRGEIKVILFNSNPVPLYVQDGDRIAQLVLSPVTQADFLVVDKLTPTPRGTGGLGSTGVK